MFEIPPTWVWNGVTLLSLLATLSGDPFIWFTLAQLFTIGIVCTK